jgi:hypothetical protein
MNMHIPTAEEDYEYRMRQIVSKFLSDYPKDFEDLSPEEVGEKLWEDFPKEFGRAVLEDMTDFAGDELFKGVTD